MHSVKIADLKNNLSRYLAYVREGGEVLVLDRDTPVARLIPVTVALDSREAGAASRLAAERLEGLERQGLVRRGNWEQVPEWLDGHQPVTLPAGSGSVVRALLDLREEDTR